MLLNNNVVLWLITLNIASVDKGREMTEIQHVKLFQSKNKYFVLSDC